MKATRLIVKYPNRRMYDLGESRYITLADIRSLVSARTEFKVTEKKSRLDITNRVLLQVITEHEALEEPVLNREFLLRTILSYDTHNGEGMPVPGTDPEAVRSPTEMHASGST